jgi:hypothetical protein
MQTMLPSSCRLTASRQQYLCFFPLAGVEPMDETKKLEAVEWLKQYLIPRKVNGRLTFECSARAIWERAGKPYGTFRQW